MKSVTLSDASAIFQKVAMQLVIVSRDVSALFHAARDIYADQLVELIITQQSGYLNLKRPQAVIRK